MKRSIPLLLALLICALIAACGCAMFEPPQENTDTASQEPGSIQVTSDPWGANVYLDGAYKGRTPLTIDNIPAGEHEIILTKTDYSNAEGMVTVKSGETVTFRKSLPESQPDLAITITGADSTFQTPNCYWEISGKLLNEGDETARSIKLTAKISPDNEGDYDYDDVETEKSFGSLAPGEEKDYYIRIDNVACVDATGSVEAEYFDEEGEDYTVSRSI